MSTIGTIKKETGNININRWCLYEYLDYITNTLSDTEYNKYETIYGQSWSKQYEGSSNFYPPYWVSCLKYFINPVKYIDRIMHAFYRLLSYTSFESHALTGVVFLKMVFLFFLWGVLETDFVSRLTENTLDTTVNTAVPLDINGDGSFSMGVGPSSMSFDLTSMTNTVSGNFPSSQSSTVILSLFILFIFASFWGSIAMDLGFAIGDFMKQASFINGFILFFKWSFFILFINNFAFLTFITTWIYLFTMTFFGVYFNRTKFLQDNYLRQLFTGGYKNLLEMDVYNYELLNEIEKIKDTTNKENKSVNQIIDNINNKFSWKKKLLSVFVLSKDAPNTWGAIIFITFIFTTLFIQSAGYNNLQITFYVVNFILLLILIFVLSMLVIIKNLVVKSHFKNTEDDAKKNASSFVEYWNKLNEVGINDNRNIQSEIDALNKEHNRYGTLKNTVMPYYNKMFESKTETTPFTESEIKEGDNAFIYHNGHTPDFFDKNYEQYHNKNDGNFTNDEIERAKNKYFSSVLPKDEDGNVIGDIDIINKVRSQNLYNKDYKNIANIIKEERTYNKYNADNLPNVLPDKLTKDEYKYYNAQEVYNTATTKPKLESTNPQEFYNKIYNPATNTFNVLPIKHAIIDPIKYAAKDAYNTGKNTLQSLNGRQAQSPTIIDTTPKQSYTGGYNNQSNSGINKSHLIELATNTIL